MEKEWGTLWRQRKRREPRVIFIAQTRCTMGEVHQHCSTLDCRCSGGESASSAQKALVREVSARCTGSEHARHYYCTAQMPYALHATRGRPAGKGASEKQIRPGEEVHHPLQCKTYLQSKLKRPVSDPFFFLNFIMWDCYRCLF